MTSDDILTHFKIIDLNDALGYLSNTNLMYSGLYDVIQLFVSLTEEQMANYTTPRKVGERKEQIIERYGKGSNDYKQFNTVVTAIGMIVRCAQINESIRALHAKYKQKEDKYKYRFDSRYDSITYDWSKSTDPDAMKIKDAAITARNKIHGYSKRYTIDGFEEGFVDKIKMGVYNVCGKFSVDTQTVESKIEDFSIDAVIKIVGYGLMFLAFFLVAKCAMNN